MEGKQIPIRNDFVLFAGRQNFGCFTVPLIYSLFSPLL